MPQYRLLINPGSSQAWQLRLKQGINTIGRASEEADLVIDHDSLSSAHCEIEISAGERLMVRDLGSTNGTFLNDRLVDKAELEPGDTLQLGSIRMVIEELPAPELARAPNCEPELTATSASSSISRLHLESSPTWVPSNPTASASSRLETLEEDKAVHCRNHFQNLAHYKCARCQRYVCDLCVNTRGTAGGGQAFCKICGQECAPVRFRQAVEFVDFFAQARQALLYPLKGDGVTLLFGGAFFFGFLDLANYVSRHGFKYGLRSMMMRVTIFTFIFGTGYLFAYLKKIIAATADGDKHMPDWPEFSEWQADIVAPMFQFLVLTVACFAPGVALQIWSEGDYPWLVWLIALIGCAYFPMGFLGIAMFDSLVALNPKFIVGSMLRVPREYTICVLLFCGILLSRWLLENLFGRLLKIPLAPALLADLVMIYLLMVEARVLGTLYLAKRDDLRWFRRNLAARR